ncbi:CCA tRNA nucleotidyltransferase [Granulicella arctica]|uniref:tRNA nucleotidyltransferase/poly(A) polymerase n=1 Tax=Granulicella arctica TaxID=940613 RepID=A0A7Y9PK82_9BACT|nr:CCA tRNA nucleotidyltransferase [Granulicella arctica]NYF80661.1 tRNA nucleotidyltransferase/poly(A) polymerase [Granulicella arctica]
MADYIYLLENRLSAGQQAALQIVREVAREQGLTVFLVGGAVRDLTSGSPVRDLDVVVQGNALKLKKQIELAGGVITGEAAATHALFVRFPGGVRMEIGSTLSVTYPKPGKPVVKTATILDDLRRRDFTVNAMALSLNAGSYGLLMDPLNGVADIENRQLRLVSNYGFIEDPVRMIRAVRFAARLGWAMDEKTQSRYDTGKQENYIAAMDQFHRGYETEEIFHEEDPLRILRKLEEEGWMKQLFPALTVAKANATELEKLREVQTQLQMRGIHPEAAAANFPLLTAKLSAKEVAELKHSFVRPGFVKEIESLEHEAKEFAAQLTGKGAAAPSDAWKLLGSAKPEAVLWVAYSSKSSAIQTKLKSYYTEWPQARNKIPYTLMQEMRIVPDLAGFDELVEKLFFALMDGKLGTVEEMKAFLESYSPPAPPPTVHLRRPRAAKKDAKGAKARKKAAAAAEAEDEVDADEDVDLDLEDADAVEDGDDEDEESDELDEKIPPPVKAAPAPKAAPVKTVAVKVAPVKAVAPVAAKAAVKATPLKVVAKKAAPAPAKKAVAPVKKAAAPAKKAAPAPAKPVTKKVAAPAKKVVPVKQVKKPAVPVKKVVVKAPVKAAPAKKSAAPAKKPVPAKKAVKVAAKKKR